MEQEIVYEKLPGDIAERYVLLMDPILGTGGRLYSPPSCAAPSAAPRRDPRQAPLAPALPPPAAEHGSPRLPPPPRPSLAGGSAARAVRVLLDRGVEEQKILFLRWAPIMCLLGLG